MEKKRKITFHCTLLSEPRCRHWLCCMRITKAQSDQHIFYSLSGKNNSRACSPFKILIFYLLTAFFADWFESSLRPKILALSATWPVQNLLVKPRIFFQIFRGEMPFKTHKIIFFSRKKITKKISETLIFFLFGLIGNTDDRFYLNP